MEVKQEVKQGSGKEKLVEQLVESVFKGRAFISPAEFCKSVLGWSESTIYKYTSGVDGRVFPIQTRRFGGHMMVAAVDYFDLLIGDQPDPESSQ